LSASELITQQRIAPVAINKRVEDVAENQDALITAIELHSSTTIIHVSTSVIKISTVIFMDARFGIRVIQP
jgi:hypothetical protein